MEQLRVRDQLVPPLRYRDDHDRRPPVETRREIVYISQRLVDKQVNVVSQITAACRNPSHGDFASSEVASRTWTR